MLLAQTTVDAIQGPYWIEHILTPILVNTASGVLVGLVTLATGWWLLKKTNFYGSVSNLWQQRVPAYQKLISAAFELVAALTTVYGANFNHERITSLGWDLFREIQAVKIFCSQDIATAMSNLLTAANETLDATPDTLKSRQDALKFAHFNLQQAIRKELKIEMLDCRRQDSDLSSFQRMSQ